MYVHRALAGAVALAVVAVPLFVFSLTGPWFSWGDGQVVRYVAGVASIAAIAGAVAQYREWEARRRWSR